LAIRSPVRHPLKEPLTAGGEGVEEFTTGSINTSEESSKEVREEVELCLGSWKNKTLSEYQKRIISILASATKAVIII